jgi:addiction module HigA family antidote
MIPEVRRPGAVLAEELRAPHGITMARLAAHLDLEREVLAELLEGRAPVTAPIAWGLAQAFRTTPELWMNLQAHHDLGRERPGRELVSLVPRPR